MTAASLPGRLCYCGSGLTSAAVYDARGIFACYTCPRCHARRLTEFRSDIFTDANYWTDEPVEEDDIMSAPNFISQEAAQAMYAALTNLCQSIENWTALVEKVIGRQPLANLVLVEAKQALALARGEQPEEAR